MLEEKRERKRGVGGANKSVLVLIKNKKKFGKCEGKGNKSYVKGPSSDAVKLFNPTINKSVAPC